MVNVMRIRSHAKSFTLFLLCLLASAFAHAANSPAPRASVDRTIVTEGDSLTLTIRIDDTGSYDEPDFSALQKDFEIYGTSQSTQHAIDNGRIESHTEWQTTLIPKRSGQLQIPPLAVAGAQTQPITIQVNPQSQSSAADSSEPVFVEVQTDNNNVYVQQQILLTARVYVAVQLDNMQLSKPEFDNASVQQISETTFNRNVHGIPYEVHELSYAIFPQQPGELTIPELVFSAVEVTGGRSLFDFPGRGRPIRKMSRQLAVHVKPIPKNFTGSVWLPARNLTLSESWSGDQQHLTVGDSITHTVAINADGLLAAQLPKLEQPQLDSAKLYAEPPKLENRSNASGVQGKRIENTALIPTRTGAMQLPETRVVWWDIDSDSEKVATLPGETLTIAAGSSAYTAPAAAALPQTAGAAQSPTAAASERTATPTAAENKTLLIWQLGAAALGVLWLATLIAYLHLRRQLRNTAARVAEGQPADGNESSAWREFAEACRANNPATARQKLLRWSAIFYAADNVHSLEQLLRITGDAQLMRELHLLDNRLFGTLCDSGEWNGANLLAVLQNIRKEKPRKSAVSGSALPPLYPAA